LVTLSVNEYFCLPFPGRRSGHLWKTGEWLTIRSGNTISNSGYIWGQSQLQSSKCWYSNILGKVWQWQKPKTTTTKLRTVRSTPAKSQQYLEKGQVFKTLRLSRPTTEGN
jgi:hypothetical protein